jgi:malate dehydrogenase (oxaloacetate-decarboxylating)(NADP+)
MTYVVYGERPAAIAILKLLEAKGAEKHNVLLVDSKGLCYFGREKEVGDGAMNEYQERYQTPTQMRTLREACVGADVLIGVSHDKDIFLEDIIENMNDKPIIILLGTPE